MNNIKVMIVDDHAVMRDGVRALIGYQADIEIVGEAEDGREAVARALELRPDVVVMDIGMPVMDGLEATRRIARKLPATKVLMLTQRDTREYVLTAIKAGASGFIPKRALGSELMAALRTIHGGGSYLDPSVATALVESYRDGVNDADIPYDNLTAREREILKLLGDGNTGRQIAERLNISLKTVYGHISGTMKKLDIRNRGELIRYAIRAGLVSVNN